MFQGGSFRIILKFYFESSTEEKTFFEVFQTWGSDNWLEVYDLTDNFVDFVYDRAFLYV